MTDLPPCVRCAGTGRVRNPGDNFTTTIEAAAAYEALHAGIHATHRDCPGCKGDGTQIRADLELMADAIAAPSSRRWKILVCDVCHEHVNDCTCDPADYRLTWPNATEPPSSYVEVVPASEQEQA